MANSDRDSVTWVATKNERQASSGFPLSQQERPLATATSVNEIERPSAISTAVAWPGSHAPAHSWAGTRTGTGGNRMVGAEHSDSGTKFGSSKGDHVLPDVGSNDFAMLRRGIVQDPLDEVVSVLIARDVNQGDASTITTSFADSVEVAAKEFSTANLEALLNHL